MAPITPPISLASLLILLISLACYPSAEAYKVLVFSQTLTRSHMMLNARVAETLQSDGHNVTILEVEYLEPLSNFSGSEAKGVRKINVPGEFMAMSKEMWRDFIAKTLKPLDLWQMVANQKENYDFQTGLNDACEKFIDVNGALLDQLRSEKFDLFIGEQLNFCGSGLSRVIGIPVHILLVSCPIQEHVSSVLGLHMPASYVPSLYGKPFGDIMSMFERFQNWIGQLIYGNAFLWGMDDLSVRLQRRFGKDLPSVRDIVKDSPLVFVNVDEFADFPRPLFSHLVYIGGLELEASKASEQRLKEPFRTELTKGARGVVFFSLGSAVRTQWLPPEFMQNVLRAVAQLPEWHFIVKVAEEDELSRELAKGIPNIHLTTWAPQPAILAHPRTHLFITHGGYNSLLEGARAGVPVLAIGFFADQRRNARMMARNGWGLAFENWRLLEGPDAFRDAIRTMLSDDEGGGENAYRRSAERVKRIMATKPFTAREKLTRYIRFLEQNDGRLPELLPESRDLTTMELYNLDLALLGVALLLATVAIAWQLLRCFKTRIARRGRRTRDKTD